MLDWLTKNKPKDDESSQIINVRVIGDRAAGKTTYMASLARWPNANPSSAVKTVTAFNSDGDTLIAQAQNVLEQGLELEPTELEENSHLKDYGLRIVLNGHLSPKNQKLKLGSSTVTIAINCKDYSGEFFSDLLYRTGDRLLQEYLEDCLQAEGILFLMDGIAYNKDGEYARGLDKFLGTFGSLIDDKKRRVALVLTKCEQPDLWINRHRPRDLAIARFPESYNKLEAWQQLGKGTVEYFTASAFGMLGSRYPEPNAREIRRDRGGVASAIKDTKLWRPFGLVSPIYWLYTGKRHQGLDIN